MKHLILKENYDKKTIQYFLDLVNNKYNLKEICSKLELNLDRYELSYKSIDSGVGLKIFSSDIIYNNTDLILHTECNIQYKDHYEKLDGHNTYDGYGWLMMNSRQVNNFAKKAVLRAFIKVKKAEPDDLMFDCFKFLESQYGFKLVGVLNLDENLPLGMLVGDLYDFKLVTYTKTLE